MPDAPIRFGTSGWRGVLAEDFTFPRLRRALRGIADWFACEGGGEVLVGHDTRFLGESMALEAVALLAERGLRPVLGRGALPTPVIARAVRRRRAAGALVITASHNPPAYQGLKVFGAQGACIDDATARALEARIGCASSAPSPPPPARLRPADLRGPYLRELRRRLDPAALGRARLEVVYDAMHGAGAGVLDALLASAGLRVHTLRAQADPAFGGGLPDPVAARLGELRRAVRRGRGRRLGLATDGDADRFAAVDADGRVLTETEAVALLVDHLARTGRVRRGVAISLATGSLVERVARSHGLAVTRHPIGFKHLSRALSAGEADVAGEESGGFAVAGFGLDKDGILAGALLAEVAAATAAPLRRRLAALEAEHGTWACGRAALPASERSRERLTRLQAVPPRRVDTAAVREISRMDGLHLRLDDGFVMWRASGTEPVLRVYAEAPGQGRLRRRLRAAAALLGASGVSRRSR